MGKQQSNDISDKLLVVFFFLLQHVNRTIDKGPEKIPHISCGAAHKRKKVPKRVSFPLCVRAPVFPYGEHLSWEKYGDCYEGSYEIFNVTLYVVALGYTAQCKELGYSDRPKR